MSGPFAAWRFDGRTAEAHRVWVRVEGAALIVEPREATGGQRLTFSELRFSESFERAPRIVHTASGETLEVSDGPAFSSALSAAGIQDSPISRLQRRWPVACAALALLLAALAWGYFRGIPIVSRWLAESTPPAVQRRMGEEILALLDREFLAPSALHGARSDAIALRFASASLGSAPHHYVRLEFRSLRPEEAEPEGDPDQPEDPAHQAATINAFSLPGGIVIVLDGLVEAADRDEVFAVLGHELGHVVHGHSMQHLLRSAGVAALAGLVWGDFSGVAASVPATLGLLHYSRDMEREADDFAVRFLVEHRLDAAPLCRFFDRILELEQDLEFADIPEFLSTHPDTGDRLARICPQEPAS